MKKVFLFSALSLATWVSSAHAADTALLKVTGKLTNAACTPALSNGGIADYGRIYLGDLNPTATNQLGTKNLTLNITCPSATKVAWDLYDNRADTNAFGLVVNNADITGASDNSPVRGSGLGKTAGGVEIGAWTVYVDLPNVKGNGVNTDLISTVTAGTVWAKSTTGEIFNDNSRMVTVAAVGSIEPLPITDAEFPLVISTAIQGTTTLAITDDTNLDGEATITLKYL